MCSVTLPIAHCELSIIELEWALVKITYHHTTRNTRGGVDVPPLQTLDPDYNFYCVLFRVVWWYVILTEAHASSMMLSSQ